MERRVSDKTILDEFAEEFCEVISEYVKYIICSGFVAIAHGRTRGTEDIDMIIEKMTKEKFVEMHNKLKQKGFVCMQSDNPEVIYVDYLNRENSVRYVRDEEGYFPPEMEIKFPKDELDEEQIKNRVKLPLTGINVFFASIESNIAFKEEYLRSNKDLEDAKHLRIIYENKLDENKIKSIKEKIRRVKYGKR
ncbi:MAG: hypothetical protein U9Q06_03475 [Nanoarchaeota archaeon]|nr:hypothetical protein [Nanoarchaeota archaeon]